MTDTTEVERFEPYTDEGNREGYGQMEPCENGDWVRATDYDALAAKLAAAERRERQLLDTTATCRMLRRELNTAKAKLAEVEAERDKFQDYLRKTHADWEKALDRAEAAEAKLAEADAMIEAQQKDYASNNVRFAEAEHRAKAAEAALPAVYRLALEDAYWSREVTPTPTAAELMARINEGEKE